MKRKCTFLTLVLIGCLSLGGCASTGSTRWYAPATWFSHSAADKADKAAVVEDTARDNVVKAAQQAAHKTQDALAAAPASRPVTVARVANDNAVALLDQANGPLTAGELTAIRQQVADLLSENADIRAKAESAEAANQTAIAAISTRLADAIRGSETANASLRDAFERENALANELRTQRALKWILGSVAVLAGAGYLYVRFFLGGIPSAIGGALSHIERTSPGVADVLRNALDSHLNRSEQSAIRAGYSKAKL